MLYQWLLKSNGKQRIKGCLIQKLWKENPITDYDLCRFWKILVPEHKGKKMSLTNKYQKHVYCSYGYKLVCVNDKFFKPF